MNQVIYLRRERRTKGMNATPAVKNNNRITPESFFNACINEAYDPYIKNEIDFLKNINTNLFKTFPYKEEKKLKRTQYSTNTFYTIDKINEDEIILKIFIPETESLNKENLELYYENDFLEMNYKLKEPKEGIISNITDNIYFKLEIGNDFSINKEQIESSFSNNILTLKLRKESRKTNIKINFL